MLDETAWLAICFVIFVIVTKLITIVRVPHFLKRLSFSQMIKTGPGRKHLRN